jgi:hypothetical protein
MAFRDPAFALVYGASKIGKTTDTIYSFPEAYYLAPPGALKPSENVVGWDIPDADTFDPKTVPEATAKLRQVAQTKKKFVVVVDDFSLLTELSFAALEAKGLSGWKLWGALQDEVLDFRDTARRLGIHVIMNCHEQGAKLVNGFAQRGGPKLPGKLPESLPAGCDIVLRATPGSNVIGAGKLGWGGTYKCNPNDPAFVTGDRHGVTPDSAPMNLAEILRAAGYPIPRPEKLGWMERAVVAISERLWNGGPQADTTTLREASQWLAGELQTAPVYQTADAQKRNLLGLHVRWVIRDAYDRILLMRARANPLGMFFNG